MNPSGASKTASRWLIQQLCSSGSPPSRRPPPSRRTRSVRPNSPDSADSTCRRAPAPSPASRNRCPAAGSRDRAAGSGTPAPPPRRPKPVRRRGPAPSGPLADLLHRGRRRQQLGEDAAFADPPGDQLRVLAAEVEDQHLLQSPHVVGSGSGTVAAVLDRTLLSHRLLQPPPRPRLGRWTPSRPAARSAASCPRSSAPAQPSPRPAGRSGCPRSHRWPSRFSAPPSG